VHPIHEQLKKKGKEETGNQSTQQAGSMLMNKTIRQIMNKT